MYAYVNAHVHDNAGEHAGTKMMKTENWETRNYILKRVNINTARMYFFYGV